jgi:hypothetical protein
MVSWRLVERYAHHHCAPRCGLTCSTVRVRERDQFRSVGVDGLLTPATAHTHTTCCVRARMHLGARALTELTAHGRWAGCCGSYWNAGHTYTRTHTRTRAARTATRTLRVLCVRSGTDRCCRIIAGAHTHTHTRALRLPMRARTHSHVCDCTTVETGVYWAVIFYLHTPAHYTCHRTCELLITSCCCACWI